MPDDEPLPSESTDSYRRRQWVLNHPLSVIAFSSLVYVAVSYSINNLYIQLLLLGLLLFASYILGRMSNEPMGE